MVFGDIRGVVRADQQISTDPNPLGRLVESPTFNPLGPLVESPKKHIFRGRCIMSFMASWFQTIIFFGDSTRGPRGFEITKVNQSFYLI